MVIMEIVVAVTGATGAVYAVRLMEALKAVSHVRTHLILSAWGEKTLNLETGHSAEYLRGLADYAYDCRDLGSGTASGSFLTDGMVILPCSMKTLGAIANGYENNLVTRSASVMIKEGRKLVLCPRETPLSAIHLENMLKLSRLGVRILPPMPAFYNRPQTVEELVDYHVMKVLDQFGLPFDGAHRWNGQPL